MTQGQLTQTIAEVVRHRNALMGRNRSTHRAEVGFAPRPFDLLPCSRHRSAPVGAVHQAFRCRHFAPQLIDLLDILLLQRTDGLEAARQAGLQLLPLARSLAALAGLVFDAQGPQEKTQLVRRAVRHQQLRVLRDELHGALALADELGEELEVLQPVVLRDFPVVEAQQHLLELIAAEDDGGLPDDLPAGGLSGGVELLHRHTAMQLGTILSGRHTGNCETKVAVQSIQTLHTSPVTDSQTKVRMFRACGATGNAQLRSF